MTNELSPVNERKMTSIFERYLTVWVALCIVVGILLGKIAPGLAQTLDGMAISVKGEVIASNPLTILWIVIPLFLQTMLIFWIGYGAAKALKLSYENAAPAAMIGASNHFEMAIATAVMLFGLSSGAALATVVGVLIEVPVMLMLVKICLKTNHWFRAATVEG